jgi:DNA invertase Pin-like site-specific DNA recombinase
MAAARRRELDVVIVWKLDRWGRSVLDLLANLEVLGTCGVRFVAVTQGLDVRPGGDAMSRLLLQVLAAVAEFERDLIRERTRHGLDVARRRGARLGRPPSSPPPDPRRVLELRGRGYSLRRIAGALEATTHSVRTILAECERKRA